MHLLVVAGVGVVGAVTAVISDTVAAAVIAGIFSVLNTLIGLVMLHQQMRTRRQLEAPRRMVYDESGNAIGTVMELRGHKP